MPMLWHGQYPTDMLYSCLLSNGSDGITPRCDECVDIDWESNPPITMDRVTQGGDKVAEILTHWGLVTPYGDKQLGQHWLW